MRYLFVSGTLFDNGGLAMIRGAMNGIKSLDNKADFRSLHRKERDKEGICVTYEEPNQNVQAFEWADVILDIGGLCNCQGNRYEFMRLRKRCNKPYVWMSQSFNVVRKELLDSTFIVARGKNSAEVVKSCGFAPDIAADLSFLVEPEKWEGKKYERVFVTHIIKEISTMYEICGRLTDIQVIWKPFRERIWEPELPIKKFTGTVEQNFGLIASVKEVHTARYHAACATILSGKKPKLYTTKDKLYNRKYDDLMDFMGMNRAELRQSAMISCQIAVDAANGGKGN